MQKAKSVKNEKNDEFIIVNSEVSVKATAALSEKVKAELASGNKEVDMEDLINAEKDRGSN